MWVQLLLWKIQINTCQHTEGVVSMPGQLRAVPAHSEHWFYQLFLSVAVFWLICAAYSVFTLEDLLSANHMAPWLFWGVEVCLGLCPPPGHWRSLQTWAFTVCPLSGGQRRGAHPNIPVHTSGQRLWWAPLPFLERRVSTTWCWHPSGRAFSFPWIRKAAPSSQSSTAGSASSRE